MALVIDGFSFVTLDADIYAKPSVSATLYLDNPTDIFVAQVALTAVQTIENCSCTAYISGIRLSNGDFLDFHTFPPVIEWADTQSVTFVLAVEIAPEQSTVSAFASASALASVTTYSEA
jgi:hypothetical protein